MKTDRLIQEVKAETSHLLISKEIAPIHLAGYQAYLDTGNRLSFEGEYFARRKQVATLALALQFEGDHSAIVQLLEEAIWEICNEYSWALPAHLPLTEDKQYGADSPKTIDLFAAETAQTLAEILEIYPNHFSNLLRNRVESEIESRVWEPFETRTWDWEFKENNWSAVIAGSIGMSVLSLMEKGSARQVNIINRLETSFEYYLKSFKQDGVCLEGVSYWVYGFGYYLYFAEKYQDVYEDTRFLKDPLLKEIAAFPFRAQIGDQRFLPFSDAQETGILPSGLLSFCHDYYAVPVPYCDTAPSLDFDHCYRWAHLYRNLTWTKPISKTKENTQHYFPDTEWLVLNDQGIIFAAKGGRNDDSHNHNDVGHFILGAGETLFLTDLGAGEYTRDYFIEETRYNFLQNRSKGHSVPIINECEQVAGNVGATQVTKTDTATGFTFKMNLEDVYDEQAKLNTFQRSFTWDSETTTLSLSDWFNFQTKEQQLIQENFISYIRPTLSGQSVSWKTASHTLILTTEKDVTLAIIEESIKKHDGERALVYRLLLSYSENTRDIHCRYDFKIERK